MPLTRRALRSCARRAVRGLRRLRRLPRPSALLLGLALGAADAAEPPAEDWVLEAPHRVEDGVLWATEGFALRLGRGWLLLGDALRWDLESGTLFAAGRVVLAIPGGPPPGAAPDAPPLPAMRIEAEELGLRRLAGGGVAGEAWDLRAVLLLEERRLRLAAAHAALAPDRIVLAGVRSDAGHGGVLGLRASRIVVDLRAEPAEERRGLERRVAGLTVWHPRLTLAGIPVLWVPVLFRDFRHDYPWTHVAGGHSGRLGYFGRFGIGFRPPPILGWHSRVRGRFDRYSRAGTALGARLDWRRDGVGQGSALWYGFQEERVVRDEDAGVLTVREAEVVDLEQRILLPGGGIYGRWVSIPDADPGTGPGPDERFRADYLEEELAERPFARRGAALAWSAAPLGIAVDHERRHHPDLDETERVFGLHLVLPEQRLVGPVHAAASLRYAGLEAPERGLEAERLRYEAALALSRWSGGLGLRLRGGARGLGYQDAVAAATALDDALRSVPFAEAAVQLRFVGAWEDLRHRVQPLLGIEWSGRGAGDPLPGLDFGDRGDVFEEDRVLLALGAETDLVRGPTSLFRARVHSRWALREEDLPRPGEDAPAERLVDVVVEALGRPAASLTLHADALWSGASRDWERLDADAAWTPLARLALRGGIARVDSIDHWQYRGGTTVIGNRYRLDADVVLDDQDEAFRTLRLLVTRRSVDGDIGVGYRLQADDGGDTLDHRFTVSFSLNAFSLR